MGVMIRAVMRIDGCLASLCHAYSFTSPECSRRIYSGQPRENSSLQHFCRAERNTTICSDLVVFGITTKHGSVSDVDQMQDFAAEVFTELTSARASATR